MSSRGYTLDAGALIGVDRGDRRMAFLIGRAFERQAVLTIPATALAQVVRSPGRQVQLMRLVRHRRVSIVPLDGEASLKVGRMLAQSGTADIADAHVVVCAQQAQQPVITSDPADLRRLDPALPLFVL